MMWICSYRISLNVSSSIRRFWMDFGPRPKRNLDKSVQLARAGSTTHTPELYRDGGKQQGASWEVTR